MSALGQKQTSAHIRVMSALPPKADIETPSRDVRFVPKADILRSTGARRYSMTSQRGRPIQREQALLIYVIGRLQSAASLILK